MSVVIVIFLEIPFLPAVTFSKQHGSLDHSSIVHIHHFVLISQVSIVQIEGQHLQFMNKIGALS